MPHDHARRGQRAHHLVVPRAVHRRRPLRPCACPRGETGSSSGSAAVAPSTCRARRTATGSASWPLSRRARTLPLRGGGDQLLGPSPLATTAVDIGAAFVASSLSASASRGGPSAGGGGGVFWWRIRCRGHGSDVVREGCLCSRCEADAGDRALCGRRDPTGLGPLLESAVANGGAEPRVVQRRRDARDPAGDDVLDHAWQQLDALCRGTVAELPLRAARDAAKSTAATNATPMAPSPATAAATGAFGDNERRAADGIAGGFGDDEEAADADAGAGSPWLALQQTLDTPLLVLAGAAETWERAIVDVGAHPELLFESIAASSSCGDGGTVAGGGVGGSTRGSDQRRAEQGKCWCCDCGGGPSNGAAGAAGGFGGQQAGWAARRQ